MGIEINVFDPENGQNIIIECNEGESLLEAMVRGKISHRAECGGRGTCGKCRVKVLDTGLKITSWDSKVFCREELDRGNRLSCKVYPKQSCSIELIPGYTAKGQEVLAEMTGRLSTNLSEEAGKSLGIAIDIGTTTLAFCLVDTISGRIIRTHTAINPQRVHGADVITRLKASTEGKQELLKELIRNEVFLGIEELISHDKVKPEYINTITIAGNTTMGHLFMGYTCETLGTYPFTPVNISTHRLEFNKLFPASYIIPVILLPGITTFVGGDILAGLLACGFDRSDKIRLLVDLGTNGEMAIGNREHIIVTSTAAGPAFEGGNISCGLGSIPGAISHVIINNTCSYETIGGKSPIGICGTGVVEIVSELLRAKLMDKTGLLEEPYFEQGYEIGGMRFTQKDVRELQLAKAAVRTGIEILIKLYQISYEDIDKVYLAGGFGYGLNVAKAVSIGLLPKELETRIEAVGNSSLSGAIEYLTDKTAGERAKRLLTVTKEIHLSEESDFNDLFIRYISF